MYVGRFLTLLIFDHMQSISVVASAHNPFDICNQSVVPRENHGNTFADGQFEFGDLTGSHPKYDEEVLLQRPLKSSRCDSKLTRLQLYRFKVHFSISIELIS